MASSSYERDGGGGEGGALGHGANIRTITRPKQSRLELIHLLTRPLAGHSFRFREIIVHSGPSASTAMPKGKGVKKATGKTAVDVKDMTESQAWKVVSQRCLHPCDMFRQASASCGCCHTQAMTAMCAISSIFVNELDTKGVFFLPGFGTFHKKLTPGKPGKMMNVFGKWKAVAPVPASTEIIYVPFQPIIDVLADHASERSGSAPSGSAPSGSAPSGSAAPVTPSNLGRPAAEHAAAPAVIAAHGTDDKNEDKEDSDVMGSDSSSSEQCGDAPAPPRAGLGPPPGPSSPLLGPF